VPDAEKSIEDPRAPRPSRVTPTPPAHEHAKDGALVQLHLWTRREDVVYLRQIAAERDQTVSAVVRSMVRAYRRSRAVQPNEPAGRDESGTATVRPRYIQP